MTPGIMARRARRLGLALALAAAAWSAPASAEAFTCGKRTCAQMTSCAEAMFHLEACGMHRLDGDSDGIPCEKLCGSGLRVTMSMARDSAPAAASVAGHACGARPTCGSLGSCEAARYQLEVCGHAGLDRDRDGIPCESLCGG